MIAICGGFVSSVRQLEYDRWRFGGGHARKAEQIARLIDNDKQTRAGEKPGQHRVGDKPNDAAESKDTQGQLNYAGDER